MRARIGAALRHLEANKVKRPEARNREFYEFVKTRLPDFAPLIRDPDSI